MKNTDIDADDMLRAQANAKKRSLAVGGVVLAVLVGGVGVALVASNRSAAASRAAAVAQFSYCMLGTPLMPGEKASARVRASQLTAMADDQPSAPDTWPSRCAPLATAVGLAEKQSEGDAAAVEAASALAKLLQSSLATTLDLSKSIDAFFAKFTYDTEPANPAVASAPAPATALSLATLPDTARLWNGLLAARKIAPFSDLTQWMLVDDEDKARGPLLCKLDGLQWLCGKVVGDAAGQSPALSLWGTAAPGRKPLLAAGVRGSVGLFSGETGARVVDRIEHGAYGASALAGGSTAYISWDAGSQSTNLAVQGLDGKRQNALVVLRRQSGNPYYATALFWDTVAYKQVRTGAEGIRLVVRTLTGLGALGAPLDVGRIDEVGHIEYGDDEPHLTACRSADTTVIRAKGWENTYLTFFVAGSWTPPVVSTGLWGKLTCGSGQATVTRVLGGPAAGSGRFKGGVQQSYCTASGCRSVNTDFAALTKNAEHLLPREAEDVKAVPVGNKLLVVWRAGSRGGVRYRLARAEELASQKDTVAFDDQAQGAESTVVGIDLLPAANGAVLLLGTTQGVYSLFVDERGAVRPMSMRVL